MNIKDLKEKLTALGIPAAAYSLNDDRREADIISLRECNGKWEVFYFDIYRHKDGIHRFENESDACWYIFCQFQ